MWIYFIMSVGWVALSLDQFVAIHYNKRRQKPIILMWSILTLIVSLIDLIFTCLLVRDYSTCNEYSEDTYNYSCYLAFGIAMTLAARGYTLWLVNVIFSFYMLRTAVNIEKRKDKFANLFSDHSIPRVTIPKANNTAPIRRSEELEPNFLNHDNSFPSFLYPTDKLDQEDTLRSFQSRSDRSNENRAPSFLSRGEKFSY
ncbi:uncharacterized protein LOC108908211 [Anoplophora glabripennis]|uniref:uncharacterized protein LOC108908211 n=1 Tax=Anoplophora glabripennis TaxID=217634 RepID=UPI000873D1FC|nr:uncharacterized protein LOC108908211 [Anoplophora glabripennis]